LLVVLLLLLPAERTEPEEPVQAEEEAWLSWLPWLAPVNCIIIPTNESVEINSCNSAAAAASAS
jgi:hypothetical protein